MAQVFKQTDFSLRRALGTRIANSRGRTIYTPTEGEDVIRDRLGDLENVIHADDDLDVLVKMAQVRYQFEAIHPFTDCNGCTGRTGRTGRIINILFRMDQELLDLPVLYPSRYIIDHESAYEGSRRVTGEGAGGDWNLYMLDALEQTSRRMRQQFTNILALFELLTG